MDEWKMTQVKFSVCLWVQMYKMLCQMVCHLKFSFHILAIYSESFEIMSMLKEPILAHTHF